MINQHYLHDILSGMDNIRKGGAGNYKTFNEYVSALDVYLTTKGLNYGERERLIAFYSQDAGSFKQ